MNVMVSHADIDVSERLLGTLEQTGRGAALLGANGRVVDMNACARRHVGETIRIEDGRLSAMVSKADGRLQKLIASLTEQECSDADRNAFVVLVQPTGSPLIVRGSTLAATAPDVFRSARAVVTFNEIGQRDAPKTAHLRYLFGLTAKEAEVAAAIAEGQDLVEIAARLHITKATVKTHLKMVFAKTGMRRQVCVAVLVTKLQALAN